MYKIVFIDLDGTLLNSKGEITKRTKEVILKAKEKGVMTVLNSGRVSASTIEFARQIGLDEYVISGNGSVITDLKTNEDIYINCMDKNDVLKIIDICEENSIYYNLYTTREIFTKNILYSTLFYYYENKKLSNERKIKINVCSNIKKTALEQLNSPVCKFTICNENKSIFDSIIRKLKGVEKLNVLDVSYASRKNISTGTRNVEINYYYTEVSKKGVDKWSAIEYLINKLDILPEEVIAIGDNANDIMMIENAGLGVMMGNAADTYKSRADFVTLDNNHEGVCEVYEKFILNA